MGAVGPFGLAMLALIVILSVLGWRFVRRHEHRLGAEAERALPGPLALRVGKPAAVGLDPA